MKLRSESLNIHVRRCDSIEHFAAEVLPSTRNLTTSGPLPAAPYQVSSSPSTLRHPAVSFLSSRCFGNCSAKAFELANFRVFHECNGVASGRTRQRRARLLCGKHFLVPLWSASRFLKRNGRYFCFDNNAHDAIYETRSLVVYQPCLVLIAALVSKNIAGLSVSIRSMQPLHDLLHNARTSEVWQLRVGSSWASTKQLL